MSIKATHLRLSVSRQMLFLSPWIRIIINIKVSEISKAEATESLVWFARDVT